VTLDPTLADAGPLIALIDEDDPHHGRCEEALSTLTPPLITTWPVIAEAMYRLGQIGGATGAAAQKLLWGYIHDELLLIAELDAERRQWADHYMTKYADLPCDLADATLLALAEAMQARRVFTIDKDFYVYVLADGSTLEAIPGPFPKGAKR